MKIRTRFAPSPTGMMHAGSVRTALFAWLFAKQNDGQFILRIEDTDKAREDTTAVKQIMDSLDWLGLEWDEGPKKGGEFGPYIQSERLDIYKHYADQLVAKGLAYADPYTRTQVEGFRKQSQEQKRPFIFREYRPSDPPVWDGSQPLRFKVTNIKRYDWTDLVRGKLTAGEEALDDFIIIKSDGFPTYNFAHVIDDYLMKITHVMRGEEFIASVPKFLSLYDAFGWDYPQFVTLPPVLNRHGGKKLSKRDGAKNILEYKNEGYLPDAILNFLASLGWNDGSEQEVFDRQELLEKFNIERIQRKGAKFDDSRLVWLNGQHVRRLSVEQLYNSIDKKFWPKSSQDYDDNYKMSVLGIVQERLKYFAELPELTSFFFAEPTYAKNVIAKTYGEQAHHNLEAVQAELSKSDFSLLDLETRLRQLAESLSLKPGELFGLIRLTITGQKVAPGLFETLNVLGKERSLARITAALNSFTTSNSNH